MAQIKYTGSFYYRSCKKHSRIQYYERKVSDTRRILVFSDIDESEKCRFNYQCCIAQEKKGYTLKKLKEQKEFFGVYVLQTNSSKSAQEVFESNKNVGGL